MNGEEYSGVIERLERIDEHLDRMDGRQDRVEQHLFGNGAETSVIQKLMLLEYEMENFRASRNDWRRLLFTIAGGVVTALAVAALLR